MSEQINKNGTAHADSDPSLKSAINKISEADAYARLKRSEQSRRLKDTEENLQRNIESAEREREVREREARERAERELAARRYAEEYRKRLKEDSVNNSPSPKAAKKPAPKSEPENGGVRTADILERAAEYRKRMKALYSTDKADESTTSAEEKNEEFTPLTKKKKEAEPESSDGGKTCTDSKPADNQKTSFEKEKIILKIEEEKPNDKLLFIPGEEFYGANTPEVNQALAAVIGAYRANLKLEERHEDAVFAQDMELAVKEGDAQRYSKAAEARLKFADEIARRKSVLENEIAKITRENPTLISILSAEEAKYERILEESKRRKEEMRESYERRLKEAFGDKYVLQTAKGRDEEFREDVSLALKGANLDSDKRAIEEYEKHLEKSFFTKEEKKLSALDENKEKKNSSELELTREYEKSLEKKEYEKLKGEEEFAPVKREDSDAVREYEKAKKKDEPYLSTTYKSLEDTKTLTEYEKALSDESEKDDDLQRTKRDILDEEAIRAYDKYNEKRELEEERRRRATGKGLTEDLMPIVEESFHSIRDRKSVV